MSLRRRHLLSYFFTYFMALVTWCFPVDQGIGAEDRTRALSANTMSLRAGLTSPAIPLSIDSSAANGSTTNALNYEQNITGRLGLGLDYDWLGFFITVVDVANDVDTTIYGETEYVDFQLHSYMGRVGFDFYYQDFTGYYLSNTQEITGGACCLLRPDLRSRYLGANFFYLSNPDHLSLVAAGNLTAIQVKGGGSWIYSLGFSRQEISSDAVVAPAGYETEYGRLGNIKKGAISTSTLGAGYGYNFVLGGPWILHASIVVGVGPQKQNFETQDYGPTNKWSVASKATGRFTLGWSGERSFLAAQVVADSTLLTIESQTLDFTSIYSFLSGGIRFDL